MSNDDRMDEIIKAAASEYNRPPATPRDDMWSAIQAARATAATGPQLRVVAGGAPQGAPQVGYARPQRSTPRHAWFGLVAAAVLLVATGVGIGRWTSPAGDAEQRVADAPSLTPAPTAGSEIGSTPRENVRPATGRAREDIRRNPIVRGTSPLRLANNPPPTIPASSGEVQAVSYQVVTQQHLQDAEALLTSFAIESRDERMNSQFAGWAKGLLSNTRLLLDSPAGDDPRRAKLLQDLEMVLAQIVQLSPDAPASERELVHGSIQNGLVMTRLRSAIPADQPREITER